MNKKHYKSDPDRNGDIHTRSSVSTHKTFTHCVVFHGTRGSTASWSSRLDLAQKLAAAAHYETEILTAHVIEKPLPSKDSKAVRNE